MKFRKTQEAKIEQKIQRRFLARFYLPNTIDRIMSHRRRVVGRGGKVKSTIRQGCVTRRVPYQSAQSAKAVAKYLAESESAVNHKLTPYQCSYCHQWHLSWKVNTR